MKVKTLQVTTVNTLDEKLIKEWKELWDRAENANIYNSYEWYLTTKASSNNKNYIFYVCYEESRLVAMLPMEHYSLFGISVLGTINKQYLIDTGFLMESYDKELFRTFFGQILINKHVFLQKIDNKAAAILHELFPQIFLSIMSVNPMLPMKNDPFQKASPSTVSQVKRLLRKYDKNIEYEVYTENLEKHFEEILKLQKKSSKHARSKDIFEDEHHRNYYRNLIKYCGNNVVISFLYFDKKPIGYIYNVTWKDTFLGEQISFHNDYRKVSPGKLMVYLLIDYIKKNNFSQLDMGGGISPYKMSFTNEYRILYNAHSSSNIFVLWWWKAITLARRVKQILLPEKFSRDHEFLFKPFAKER